MKILIADDDPVSRTLMIEILQSAQAGYTVISVDDGSQAWKALEDNPDLKLAIFDLSMPGLDGIELLRRARADSRFSRLPIIVCTATSDRATVSAVAAHGVNDFVVKPFTRTVVLDKVWHLCRPVVTGVPVLKDLTAARQRLEIDREVHRELLGYFVRIADMWATDARRATEFPRVRALSIRAGSLKQMLGSLGAAAAAARFQEAEERLAVFKTKPVGTELPACIRAAQTLGEKIQPDIDRLREMLDTIG
ncbi:MAG TPA: response regulator [Opitutaceae bacterium]|nr:response regulator [Opitutaceae bacterium]